jgi:putative membrane protein
MKMKLAIVLACGALAGFVIAATKPPPGEEPLAKNSIPSVPTTASAEHTLPGAIGERSDTAPVPAGEPSDRSSSRSSSSRTTKDDAAPPQLIHAEIGGKDLQFLLAAIEDGYTQLYLGQLAQSRAETEQIKAVGIVLATTQAEENRKLTRLASMKGIALPGAAAAGQKRVAAKLEKLQGPRFEKQLMEEIINVNEHAVANYEAAAGTRDSDIRAFVEEALPLAKEKLLLTNKMTGTARRSDKEPGFRGVSPAPPDSRERR